MPHLPQYLIPCTVRHAPTSDMKQRTPKGNTVLFDQCDGRCSEPGHTDEHLDAVCGESRADGVTAAEVTRHHGAPFSLLSCHKNTTTYTLCSSPAPSRGPRPQPHYVVFFKSCFYSCGNFKCCRHVVNYRHFEELSERGWREAYGGGRGGDVEPNPSTIMLLLSLFTCCKLWSTSHTQDGFTMEASQLHSISPGVIRHPIYLFFFSEK